MDYDLIVIGAGWAGINAATRARDAGWKVALIERKLLGGTCLNAGCIPTKSLIHSAKTYAAIKKSATFGIHALEPSYSFIEIQQRKERVVTQLRNSLQSALKGIDFINAEARLLSEDAVSASGRSYRGRFILIASGSKPFLPPTLQAKLGKCLTSDDALSLERLPASLLIVGGGVIGCEFASFFSALGCRVTVVELMPQLLPGADNDIARKLESSFKKKGIRVHTATDAQAIDTDGYESVLACIGRTADTEGLGLESAGIVLERSRVVIDGTCRTNLSTVFAAGDCCSKIMLAHYAAFQGRLAVESMLGLGSVDGNAQAVPSCIFTDPEVAFVGLREEEARSRGFDVCVHRLDFLASGMARIIDETEGFIKIIAERKKGAVLGAAIIGPRATELITNLTLAIQHGLSVEQLRMTIFPHPTLSEAISEALG